MEEEKKPRFWNMKVSDLTVLDTLKLKSIAVALSVTGTIFAAVIVEKIKSDTNTTGVEL